MQIIGDKVLLVRTNNPQSITGNIKKSKLMGTHAGVSKVAVHWGMKEARALAAVGQPDVPSPILRDYTWTGRLKPFDHQKTTSSFFTLHERAFCFNEQGTGKTASVIWASDYLMGLGEIKRVLILCPLSIMDSAWRQDIFKFAMHRSCGVAYGDAKRRVKVIDTGAEFVMINFDGVSVVEDEIIAGGFDLIVVDECSAYKNPTTSRWKVLNRIINITNPRLWMLTGTPAAQSPVDAFGLAKLVNPNNTPKYYGAFRDSVMFKVTQFKWTPRPNAQQTVHNVLQPAIRFEKKDCLDLPAVVHVDRIAPLTKMQQSYYNALKNDMLFETGGEEVSAINAAIKLNKLLQISGGAVYSDDGAVIKFDVSNRLNAVQEVIEEAANKVLVFVPFTHTIELLRDRLTKAGITCDVINGKVAVGRRGQIVTEFQTKVDPKVLIIQPQAASHGLTLTAADTIIWYAPVTSVETYLQANARINRPGQKNAMTIVHIKGSPVEERLYYMLQNNIDNHEKIIDLYRQIISTSP